MATGGGLFACSESSFKSAIGFVQQDMLSKQFSLFIVIGALGTSLLAACGDTADGRVFFIEPRDGAQVKSPFSVKMGTEDLVVEPAREDVVYQPGHGHHHIIVDAAVPILAQPIPSQSLQHLHLGKGQHETTLDLPPGEHTLRLLFAKGDHIPWSSPQMDAIKITVVE